MFENLKEKYRYAKENLNLVRYQFNYIYSPCLFGFAVLDLLVCICLLIFSQKTINALTVVLLCLFLAALVAYVVLAFITRKKEREIEAEKLKVFFEAKLLEKPSVEYVLPRADTTGVVYLTFKDKVFTIENEDYAYDDFDCALYTSNYMYQVNLIIVFTAKSKDNEVDQDDHADQEDQIDETKVKEFSLPLNLNLLSVMDKFNIHIINPDVLKFIKENHEQASKQIMKYGRIQTDFYNVN